MDFLNIELANNVPQRPTVTVNRNGWVDWGTDNDYPNQLAELVEFSPVHQAIIQLKTQLTHGSGLAGLPENLSEGEVKEINETLRRVSMDKVVSNGYALQIIWSKGAVNGSFQIAEMGHLDFTKVRLQTPNQDGKIENVLVSRDWSNRKIKPEIIPVFNPEKAGTEKLQILYVTGYTPGHSFYPSPDYSAAINYINLDYEISKYHINNVSNGLTPGMIFKVPEVPPEEDRLKLKADIKREFMGTDKAGRFMVLFSHDRENMVEVSPLATNNNADIYNTLEQITTQKIITGHRLASPVLAGLPGGAGNIGSNAGEIVAANQYFLSTVIKPNYQKPILETFEMLFAINGEVVELSVVNNQPIENIFSESLLADILTDNELRALAGYEPIQENQPEQPDPFKNIYDNTIN